MQKNEATKIKAEEEEEMLIEHNFKCRPNKRQARVSHVKLNNPRLFRSSINHEEPMDKFFEEHLESPDIWKVSSSVRSSRNIRDAKCAALLSAFA